MKQINNYIIEKLIINKDSKLQEKNGQLISDEHYLFDINEFINNFTAIYNEFKCNDIVIGEIHDDGTIKTYMINKPSTGKIDWFVDSYDNKSNFLCINLYNETDNIYKNREVSNNFLDFIKNKQKFKKFKCYSSSGALSYKCLYIWYSKPYKTIKIYFDNSL